MDNLGVPDYGIGALLVAARLNKHQQWEHEHNERGRPRLESLRSLRLEETLAHVHRVTDVMRDEAHQTCSEICRNIDAISAEMTRLLGVFDAISIACIYSPKNAGTSPAGQCLWEHQRAGVVCVGASVPPVTGSARSA